MEETALAKAQELWHKPYVSKMFAKTKCPGLQGLTGVDEWEMGLLGGPSAQCVCKAGKGLEANQ